MYNRRFSRRQRRLLPQGCVGHESEAAERPRLRKIQFTSPRRIAFGRDSSELNTLACRARDNVSYGLKTIPNYVQRNVNAARSPLKRQSRLTTSYRRAVTGG